MVVLTGAGVSAESGLRTFRDSGGLWEGYDVMKVASIEGWHEDQELVLSFYNQRRKDALKSEPNQAHKILKELEAYFDLKIVTQNVDNLHEKAGSSHVLHLHGSLFEAKSSKDESLIYPMEGDIHLGDQCEKGSQLRPNIVWFGEAVPMMDKAIEEVLDADIFLILGTSLAVYPAASLIEYVNDNAELFLVDPVMPDKELPRHMKFVQNVATKGMIEVKKLLLEELD